MHKRFQSRTVLGFSVALAVAVVVASCSKKDASDEAKDAVGGTTTTTSTDPSSVVAGNKLALAFPQGLALSAFPQTGAQSLTDDGMYADATTQDVSKQTVADKAEAQAAILKGEVDSCFPTFMTKSATAPSEVTCYEFDHDMLATLKTENGTSTAIGTKDGTDGKGEACLVSFARSKISEVVDIVDRATGMVQAMMCQAKKSSVAAEPPAKEGESLDLKAALETAAGSNFAITKAKITRLADSNGRPVFRSDITVTEPDGGVREVHLVHSPKSAGSNDEFNGTMWTKVVRGSSGSKTAPKLALDPNNPQAPAPGGQQPAAGGAQADKPSVLSVTYARTVDASGKPRIKYELRSASIATDYSPFSDAGVVNYNTGADFTVSSTDQNYGNWKVNGSYTTQSNNIISGMRYIAFDVNPDNNEGTMSYWENPGANYYENARGMVFSMSAGSDGLLSGCASSGSAGASNTPTGGISIRRVMKEGASDSLSLKPRGFYHPFVNCEQAGSCTASTTAGYEKKAQGQVGYREWIKPNVSNATLATAFAYDRGMGQITTRQCFKQNASGLYVIDTDKVTEAAGYELIDMTDTTASAAKLVQPPAMTEVKEFGTKVVPE